MCIRYELIMHTYISIENYAEFRKFSYREEVTIVE